MKNLANIFKENKNMIESFIATSVENVYPERLDRQTSLKFFAAFKSLEVAYFLDKTGHQASPTYLRNATDEFHIGSKREFINTKIKMKENGTFLSNPYINSHTGQLSITYVKQTAEGSIVLDFNLTKMLLRLKLLDLNFKMQKLNTYTYGLMGFSLVAIAIFLSVYAVLTFLASLMPFTDISLQATFKSIIALTLGLAIFDLAKTILEQEVFNKAMAFDKNEDNRIFSKFLVSIVIALSIEALMVVFKIALTDHTEMIYAFYLIAGVGILILSLGLYNFFSKRQRVN
ncbi:MAG: hypothetical protein OIF32_09900 [Campylobacterales bacterium]|nr:hypothetical protein [Campylobacterales bacterium]